MNLDLEAARRHAVNAAQSIGPWLSEGFGVAPIAARKGVEATNIVTDFDTEADEKMFELLSKFDASIGFHGEERGKSGSDSTFWLVDPIDGTGHFYRGLPFCTTMVSLIDQGEVVVAVINDFVRGHVYSAYRGGGAFRDDIAIKVSDRSLRESYIGVETKLDQPGNADMLTRLQQSTTVLATINCGWDFAMVASGRFDGRAMKDPLGSLWDFAPGSLLVAEAGGVVANLNQTTYDYRNFDFLAVAPRVFADLTEGPAAIFPVA